LQGPQTTLSFLSPISPGRASLALLFILCRPSGDVEPALCNALGGERGSRGISCLTHAGQMCSLVSFLSVGQKMHFRAGTVIVLRTGIPMFTRTLGLNAGFKYQPNGDVTWTRWGAVDYQRGGVRQ
jgi:hypothetical protein